MERTIINKIQGFKTEDGAGVKLIRVLGHFTVDQYDPILMLDSFDSTDPSAYTAGFPLHPHRGIETISLVVEGNMVHKDSLGNSASISDGEVQWMTAGSGILHEEMFPASKRLLGVQLWLNLPKKDKMVKPEYRSIHKNEIQEIAIDGGVLRLVAGKYKEYTGYIAKYLPLDYYHILLKANQKITIDTEVNKSVMLFTLLGDSKVAGEDVASKTAVKLSDGDTVTIEAKDEDIQILFMSSNRLDEPVSWGGPIVMNTKEELDHAFYELNTGSFLKDTVDY